MTRFRITVRGEGAELRGYIDGSTDTLGDFSNLMAPVGLVIASPAPDDFDPFGISEPGHPPTPETSTDIIRGLAEVCDSQEEMIQQFAMMHYAQAMVIRGERYQREQAEKELFSRELHHFEVEEQAERLKAQLRKVEELNRGLVAQIEDIKAIRSNFPEKCEVHPDDEITCGWKSMVAGIDRVLVEVPT
jgi:hypothetical protein